MQAIADLRFLQITEIGVQTRQPDCSVGIAVGRLVQRQLTVDLRFANQIQDVTLQLAGAARVKQLRFVILVRQQLQICLLYTSPSPRDRQKSRMPSSA